MQSEDSSDAESSAVAEQDNEESSFLASESEEDSEDENLTLSQTRNILFLCQEGQLRIARWRFETLKTTQNEETPLKKLQKEIFQVARDKNYPLHEILMGGTNDTNANQLSKEILETAAEHWKVSLQTMLVAQPPSHQRTCLHWAAWSNSSLSLLRALVAANPEALVLRDKQNKGGRTPLEIYRHYFCQTGRIEDDSQSTKEKLQFLESSTRSWIQHRLRLAVYRAVVFYFRQQRLTPFDKNDQKSQNIKRTRSWFIISTLGYFLQREMQPLVQLTLSFVGKDAKVHGKKNKKRKRKGR